MRHASILLGFVIVTAAAAVAHRAAAQTTSPASRPAWLADPVAVVDGVPIPAGKVWDALDRPLAAEARASADPAAFRAVTAGLVRQMAAMLVREEQEVIDARARATPAEIREARQAGIAWRDQAVRDAGSPAAADRAAVEDERRTLDEAAEHRVRLALVQGQFRREVAAMPAIDDAAVRAEYAARPDLFAGRDGKVRGLDDPAVREAVVKRLRERQIVALRQRQLARAAAVPARTDAAVVDRLVDEAVRRHQPQAKPAVKT